jgi:hypothetical protein
MYLLGRVFAKAFSSMKASPRGSPGALGPASWRRHGGAAPLLQDGWEIRDKIR